MVYEFSAMGANSVSQLWTSGPGCGMVEGMLTSARMKRLLERGRVYDNEHENGFYSKACAAGWYVTKRGWPDFFCLSPEGRIVLVEVKPKLGKSGKWGLTKEQQIVLEALLKAGIEVRISDGKSLSVPFDPKQTNRLAEVAAVLKGKRLDSRRKFLPVLTNPYAAIGGSGDNPVEGD